MNLIDGHPVRVNPYLGGASPWGLEHEAILVPHGTTELTHKRHFRIPGTRISPEKYDGGDVWTRENDLIRFEALLSLDPKR